MAKKAEFPWLSEYPPEVPREFSFPKGSLFDLLERAASRFGERTAVHFFGRRCSYNKIYRMSVALASSLQELGVKPGEKVVTLLSNSPHSIIAFFGILKAGATVVSLNPLLSPREIEEKITDSGARILITHDIRAYKLQGAMENDLLDHLVVAKLAKELPFLERIRRYFFNRVPSYVPPSPAKRPVDFYGLCRNPERPLPVSFDPDTHPALFKYTGGTTGIIRAAVLSHSNLMANVYQLRAWLYRLREEGEVFFCALPFHHIFGLTSELLLGTLLGAELVVFPRFVESIVSEIIHDEKVSFISGTPAHYAALLAYTAEEYVDFSTVGISLISGTTLPPHISQQFEKITRGIIIEGYGLSEASPFTHAQPIWGRRPLRSIGLPLPGTQARIVNSSREPLPPNMVGELEIKGPQVMMGYWDAQRGEPVFPSEDGWLPTGDLATMGPDGYFFLQGRKKDIVHVRGYPVYPLQVEEIIEEHPAVKEAALVALPISQGADARLIAKVVLRKGAKGVSKESILDHCKKNLADYKVPADIVFVKEIGHNPAGGKLRKIESWEDR